MTSPEPRPGPALPESRGVAPCSDPRAARRPPSCLRREASFLLIRAGHLSIDGGGVHA